MCDPTVGRHTSAGQFANDLLNRLPFCSWEMGQCMCSGSGVDDRPGVVHAPETKSTPESSFSTDCGARCYWQRYVHVLRNTRRASNVNYEICILQRILFSEFGICLKPVSELYLGLLAPVSPRTKCWKFSVFRAHSSRKNRSFVALSVVSSTLACEFTDSCAHRAFYILEKFPWSYECFTCMFAQ
jgi:hypothetical protein